MKQITKKKITKEGVLDDVRGVNRAGFMGNENEAVRAQYEKEWARKAKQAIDSAFRNNTVNLSDVEGGAQTNAPASSASTAPGTAADTSQARPNLLQDKKFTAKLNTLNADQLEQLLSMLDNRAKMAAESLDEGWQDWMQKGKSALGKAASGIGSAVKAAPGAIGKVGKGLSQVAAVPQGFGRAVRKGYQQGVAAIGGGAGNEKRFIQVAQQIADLEPKQAEVFANYVRNILLPKAKKMAGADSNAAAASTPATAAASNTTAASSSAATGAATANAAPAATATSASPAADASAAGTKAAPNKAADRARIQKDIQTINSSIQGITQSINTNLPADQKVQLARELVNIMADNKKARPEAWQNAYDTVKRVLKNVGQQVDATMPKGRQNIQKDLLAALNAGQTRNQTTSGINTAQKKPAPKMAKSSTAKTMGKTAPAAATAAAAPGPTGPLRRVAESRVIGEAQVYFLNKFLKELDLSWSDIGYVLVENKGKDTFLLEDAKVNQWQKLLEADLYEFNNPNGERPRAFIMDVIEDMLYPVKYERLSPAIKKTLDAAVDEFEIALKNQVMRQNKYSGIFDRATNTAFENVADVVSQIAMQALSNRERQSPGGFGGFGKR